LRFVTLFDSIVNCELTNFVCDIYDAVPLSANLERMIGGCGDDDDDDVPLLYTKV